MSMNGAHEFSKFNLKISCHIHCSFDGVRVNYQFYLFNFRLLVFGHGCEINNYDFDELLYVSKYQD